MQLEHRAAAATRRSKRWPRTPRRRKSQGRIDRATNAKPSAPFSPLKHRHAHCQSELAALEDLTVLPGRIGACPPEIESVQQREAQAKLQQEAAGNIAHRKRNGSAQRFTAEVAQLARRRQAEQDETLCRKALKRGNAREAGRPKQWPNA